jgi:hypothetical protein
MWLTMSCTVLMITIMVLCWFGCFVNVCEMLRTGYFLWRRWGCGAFSRVKIYLTADVVEVAKRLNTPQYVKAYAKATSTTKRKAGADPTTTSSSDQTTHVSPTPPGPASEPGADGNVVEQPSPKRPRIDDESNQ